MGKRVLNPDGQGCVVGNDADLVVSGNIKTEGTSSIIGRVITFNAFNAAAGATAGWTPPTGLNKALLVCPASQTAATAVIPVTGLHVGDIIRSFKINGQIESGGNTATLDCALRKVTPATAGGTDAEVQAATQISKTADYLVADSTTLTTAETVATGVCYYFLLTATTAASTDIEVSTVELTVSATAA